MTKKPIQKCKDERVYLQCSDCDATWSDPRRGLEKLLSLMRNSPSMKHNIKDIADELNKELSEPKEVSDTGCEHEWREFEGGEGELAEGKYIQCCHCNEVHLIPTPRYITEYKERIYDPSLDLDPDKGVSTQRASESNQHDTITAPTKTSWEEAYLKGLSEGEDLMRDNYNKFIVPNLLTTQREEIKREILEEIKGMKQERTFMDDTCKWCGKKFCEDCAGRNAHNRALNDLLERLESHD